MPNHGNCCYRFTHKERDDGPFENRWARGNFVRVVWCFLFCLNLIQLSGALTGSFVKEIKEYARENTWTMFGILIGLMAANSIPYCILMFYEQAKYITPINILISLGIFIINGGIFLCGSSLIDNILLIPLFTLSLEGMIFSVIFFSFFLDVSKWFLYVLSILLVGGLLLSLLIFMYLDDNLSLAALFVTSLGYVAFSMCYSSQIIRILNKIDELELDQKDYLIGLALFITAEDSGKRCCAREQ